MTVYVEFSRFTELDEIEMIISLIREDKNFSVKQSESICISAPNLGTDIKFTDLFGADHLLFDVLANEASLFFACLEFARQESFRHYIRVDDRGDYAAIAAISDELHLSHLERLLLSGKIRAAAEGARPLRRSLQAHGTPLGAELAEIYKDLLSFYECLDKCRTPTFPESGSVLRKRGLDTDARHFLNTHLDSLKVLAVASPATAPLFASNAAFFMDGSSLAPMAFRKTGADFSFFVWLAIYFHRFSSIKLTEGDSSEALALLIRSLEYYAIYVLASVGVIYFDAGALYWTNGGSKVTGGVSELWDAAVLRFDPNIRNSLASTLTSCEEAISLRNRGIFGHGMQKLKSNVVADYGKAVRLALAGFEQAGADGGARWTNLWSRSQPVTFDVLRNLVEITTAKRQRSLASG